MSSSCRPTGQGDALLVARLPLAVLVHRAALAAGLLVTHEGRVVLGAKVVLHHGSLQRGRVGLGVGVNGGQRAVVHPDR